MDQMISLWSSEVILPYDSIHNQVIEIPRLLKIFPVDIPAAHCFSSLSCVALTSGGNRVLFDNSGPAPLPFLRL